MEPICDVQGIFKWKADDYEFLESIERTEIGREAHLFFALDFHKKPDMKMVIIDVIYDFNKRSKYLIRDPQKVNTGYVEIMGTDVNDSQVWLGYVDFPPYDKYLKAGKHSVRIQVAPYQSETERSFAPEIGGVTADFEFEIIDDREDE